MMRYFGTPYGSQLESHLIDNYIRSWKELETYIIFI